MIGKLNVIKAKLVLLTLVSGLFITLFSVSASTTNLMKGDDKDMDDSKLETATLGAGCFWCVEAVFQDLRGVHSVISGYTGGHVKNPSYQEVTSGKTGHAEVAQIKFDPKEISYADLLYVFWLTHDPTTLNKQGADVGTQYRSAIFYHNDEQKQVAEKSKAETDSNKIYPDPIVTEIEPLTEFYKAEGYHQDYFNLNPNQPYCRFVIDPKVQKMKKQFKDKLK
jgi:peptide-methionine (S)-S-oxide reductase